MTQIKKQNVSWLTIQEAASMYDKTPEAFIELLFEKEILLDREVIFLVFNLEPFFKWNGRFPSFKKASSSKNLDSLMVSSIVLNALDGILFDEFKESNSLPDVYFMDQVFNMDKINLALESIEPLKESDPVYFKIKVV